MRVALVVLAVLALGYFGLLAYLGAASRRPRPTTPIAARDGELRPCRRTTNCVCSQPGCGGRQVEPLAFGGPAEAAMERLAATLVALPGVRVVERDGGYLRAEARSRVFGFVDDFEARPDPATGVIHVRSASRVGISDRGVNARRVTLVRERFAASEGGGSER